MKLLPAYKDIPWLNIWRIIIASLKIAFLSFGGGNAVVGIIYEEFGKRYNWVNEQDFNKLVILANIFPGPIIMKICMYISFTVAGYLGAIACFLFLAFPGALLLIFFLEIFYSYIGQENMVTISKAILPTVMAMLFVFTWDVFQKDLKSSYNWLIYILILLGVLIAMLMHTSIVLVFAVLITSLAIFRFK